MRLRPEQLTARLAQSLPPVVLLTGDEPLQLLEAADQVRRQAQGQGFSERVILEVDRGFAWDQLAGEGANRSLFAERRLLDLRLASAAIGNEGSKALVAWCERPSPDTLLLITAPKLDSRQQGGKWVKAIEQTGLLVQIWPQDGDRLAPWLEQRMRARGLAPQPGVSALLAERVEGNLLAAAQEIEKLLLLQGPGTVSVEGLRAAVADSARFDAFDLVDEALLGHGARCLRILSGLRAEGVAEPLILWALARELRGLYGMALGLAEGRPLPTILAGVWDKRKPQVTAALRRLRPVQLRQGLRLCQRADGLIKGVGQGDPWLALERICLLLCGIPLATAA